MSPSAARTVHPGVGRPSTVPVAVVAAVLAGLGGLAMLVTYPIARSAIGEIVPLPGSHNPQLDLRDSAGYAAVIGAVTVLVAAATTWLLLAPRRRTKVCLLIGWAVVICGQLVGFAGGAGANWQGMLPAFYPPLQYAATLAGTVLGALVLVLLFVRPTDAYLDARTPVSADAEQQVFDLDRIGRHD